MVHVSGQGGVHGHTGAVPRRAGRAVRPVTDRHGLQRPRTRARRTNAAFRQLVGLPDEAIIGRQPSEAEVGFDGALVERALAEQVISRGVPLIDMYVEQTVAGERRVFSWSAFRVTDNGQVLGALGLLVDVTGRVQAVTALRQANARLDLLERAGSQIGATLDCHRTAGELAALAVPEVADRIVIDLLDEVLQGESPPRPGSGILRFRRVAVRDAKTGAKIGYKVGDLITAPQLGGVVAAHGDEAGATCLYAAYDPKSRRCRLTSAGHLPPALRHPGGRVEFLDIPVGLLLGAGPGRYPAADIQLPPGSVLALYTDGLVEQPGQDIGTGLSRLARALGASPARSLDDLCDSVLASLGPPARDDIALLLARPVRHGSHVP